MKIEDMKYEDLLPSQIPYWEKKQKEKEIEKKKLEAKKFKEKDITINQNFLISVYRNNYKAFFNGLFFKFSNEDEKYRFVLKKIPNIITFFEFLNSFANNKLKVDEEYNINNVITAKIKRHKGINRLFIIFNRLNNNNSIYLDKFESASLSAILAKYIGRCEPWQNDE